MEYIRNSGRKKPDRNLQDYTYLKKFTVEQFLKAIKGSGGIKNQIARRLKCTRHTVNKYIKENQVLYDAWLDEKESMLDMCESGLIALAEKKDLGAIKYFLSTQAKDRGYGDTSKFEVNKTVKGTIEHEHKPQIELQPDRNRTLEVLKILHECGGFNSLVKQLSHSEVESGE